MMINGRPYSNENGYIDADLITSHPQEEIDAVMGWIAENILPRKTPLYGHTSYGIKHLLERDTRIYLTNNEFKDAMLQAGYKPVDPNELVLLYQQEIKSVCTEGLMSSYVRLLRSVPGGEKSLQLFNSDSGVELHTNKKRIQKGNNPILVSIVSIRLR